MTGLKNNPLKLLVIDDDPMHLELVSDALGTEGLEVTKAQGPEEGMEAFQKLRPRMVLLDLVMPGMNGIDVLGKILAIDPGVDVIVVTAHYSSESAVEAIQKGAADYLTKPLDLKKLRERVQNFRNEALTRSNALQLDQQIVDSYQFEGIVGRSPLMLDVFAKIRRASPHFRSALITGATGTGKELAARAMHKLSPVSSGPFVVCDCSAIVETLAESEMFGYVKGAFTGANQDKKGIFELASGGTVFLDEIGELPLVTQAKLLRVLQSREVQRVGSPVTHPVDLRVIAATNRDLKKMVKENQFREDLYYRLAMLEIVLPRLSERREDLPLLQRYFLEQFSATYKKPLSGFTRRAQIRMSAYSWPGNIRQLENVIGTACMMSDGGVLDIHDLPAELLEAHSQGDTDDLVTLDEIQIRHVKRILEHVGGNKARAAEILGIGRGTIYHFLSRIHPDKSEKGKIYDNRSSELKNAQVKT